MKAGKVYLVGAGCGGKDLLTLRGAALLRTCDTVVYDDLIDPSLLDLAPPEAERIRMGKRGGRRSAAQETITQTLIAKAQEGKTVVRLKGGDPFVFGRGGEEILALQAAETAYETVPGVSSAIAVPELAGIPVTHRGVSRSFHVLTAHTADSLDGLPEGLENLAKLKGTLVFLMGLSQLPRLTERLLAGGMDPHTPAAVAGAGGAIRGTLADIAEKAAEAQPPAVIVVGETAAMDLSPQNRLPLMGVTVGLTGTAAVTERLKEQLESLGAETVSIERPAVEELPLRFRLEQLCQGPCWAVFTSANGVRVWFRRLAEAGIDLRRLHGCRFAVIGRATAKALEERGLYPDICPAEYTTQALGQLLLERVSPPEPVYLLRSRQGDPGLRTMLAARFAVKDIPLYQIRPHFIGADRPVDYMVFASAGGVERVLSAMGGIPVGTVCVCIGAVTAGALSDRYGGTVLTADTASVEAMVKAILNHRQSTKRGKPI